jgi:uncharacterized flavoprotein (TIGR03862 family)
MPGDSCEVLVIGGGPAGLRAAELTSAAGFRTILADRMPSVGRKFLVAGKGGLNLTHSEPLEKFVTRYGDDGRWQSLLADFFPDDLRAWAEGLGIETFIGTSGRVFPTTKQAAPLLRRWIARLKEQKVDFRVRHEWTGLVPREGWDVSFRTPKGDAILHARAVVLALGGGSWPETGSNGSWTSILGNAGITITPLVPANCGYEVDWPANFLHESDGKPLKNIVATAGTESVAGELLVTKYGLEGGALYQLGRALRGMEKPLLTLDLKPAFSAQQLVDKLNAHSGASLDNAARAWKLSPAAKALLGLCPVPSANALAALAKSFPLALRGPRPIDEAISSAGGVAWAELDEGLMLRRLPGVFCAGEMIDWEAPTGGYLLQGCFATATRAARGVATFLGGKPFRLKRRSMTAATIKSCGRSKIEMSRGGTSISLPPCSFRCASATWH